MHSSFKRRIELDKENKRVASAAAGSCAGIRYGKPEPQIPSVADLMGGRRPKANQGASTYVPCRATVVLKEIHRAL